ncbi:MAG: O-antigen ligase family protein [Planctomycetota bacterium]|nr:O-antigen ligase family protein [Planctomycetota bacterium]
MDQSDSNTAKLNDILRWSGVGVIALIAVMRCLIVFAPQVVFDIDPAFNSDRLAGLGPAGSLLLDIVLLLGCGAALWGEAKKGLGISVPIVGLALIPVPVFLWHGFHDLGDLWIGATWLGGAIACVTMAHLARDPRIRIAFIALLLGVAAPLLVRGLAEVTYEFKEDIASFEHEKEKFFQMQGWEVGSSSAQIFERRIRQNNPNGWFATTNIYASLLGVFITSLLGLTLASIKAKQPSGWWALTGFLSLASLVGLWMCNSMGAMLATMGGLAIFLIPLLMRLVRSLFSRFGSLILIIALLSTLGGVFVRGAMLSEDFMGDRSLLFRWHYAQATKRIVEDAPLLGVGAGSYQQAYALHREPRSPEEVKSAHSVFLDWLASVGVWGGAWIMLVVSCLWRAGAVWRDREPPEIEEKRKLTRSVLMMAIIIGGLGLTGAMLVEVLVSNDPMVMMLRLLGALLYMAMATIIASIMANASSRWIDWALVGGIMGLVIHSQIEMTLTQPGSVIWGLALLGAIAPLRVKEREDDCLIHKPKRSGPGQGLAVLIWGITLWIFITGAIPSVRQQVKLQEAAHVLDGFPRDRFQRVERRQEASDLLVEAHEIMPTNPHPIQRAAQQITFAAKRVSGPVRVELLEQALSLTQITRHPDQGFMISLRTSILIDLAQETKDAAYWDLAIKEATRLTELDPRHNAIWKRLGDVCWEAERFEQARNAYRRALEADDQFELDPLKQFPVPQRVLIEGRIEEAVN